MSQPRERVPDTCCLCNNPNDGSAEDAVPRWILKKQRLENPDIKTWYRWDARQQVEHASDAPRRVRTWYVCNPCNGFMNTRLEQPGRQLIEPLLDGKPCILNPEQQALIAGWVFKTSLMLGLTHWNADVHPPDYALRHLRATARPPASAYVWIGTTFLEKVGPGWRRFPGNSHFLKRWRQPTVVVPSRSFVDTFTINHLVAHVFVLDGIPRSVDVGIDTDFDNTMVRIWPTLPDAVHWPAMYGREYRSLDLLYARYRWSSARGPGRVHYHPSPKRQTGRTQ